MMDIGNYLKERKALVDAALAAYLEHDQGYPPRLAKAMHYSVMAGGKRLRPILVMAGAATVGGNEMDVLPCACALEMIHTFSLIHDDLPAMDDDDLRRGVPTSHKVFGEAIAILAGDGLLAEAFECLTEPTFVERFSPARLIEVIRDIAAATGPCGMVGGQVLDMEGEGHHLDAERVVQVHRHKTGALIRVSVTSGAKLAGATPAQITALSVYGNAIGLAFQIADDLLAVEGAEAELGKRVGNDAARGKATYPAMVGMTEARQKMAALVEEALVALAGFDANANALRELARYITQRRT